ncbi:MAG: ribosome small subunit-dependent GTPase A [Oscillospiraceae bacterium]|nr:ribosome small subunit-dependent GTPase A [Oscillospiraceae bacterium]
MTEQNGIIIKGIGGFYYVKTAEGILECRAKGIFRKRGITPAAGDCVRVEGADGGYVVGEIEPRTNSFQRPLVANVDRLFLVVSSVDPKPNLFVLDKFTALSVLHGVRPILLLTKTDIERAEALRSIYTHAGFEVYDVHDAAQAAAVRALAAQPGLSVFTGNSGVGKSTFLNALLPALSLETGETSKKLGRGRHTTRAVELYACGAGYVADTPGFSALDFERGERIPKETLETLFPEFGPYLGKCRFSGCSHTVEKGCAVLSARAAGDIEPTRFESYCALYAQASEQKDWD